MISLPRETILVTGSSGLIGQALVQRFAEQYEVVGLDIIEPKQLPPHATFIKMDLASDQSVADALMRVRQERGNHIVSVLHLAAYYDFSGEPSDRYEKITIKGTGRLLRELKQFDVEQFVFSSTMLVHAPCKIGEKIDEDSPIDPSWDYPKSKVQTEQLILRERGDMPVVLLRIAGVYDDECHSIPLSHQIQRIYERRLTGRVFPGDVGTGQAMAHMDDVIDVFERTVDRRKDLPQVTPLLIGEPETLSYDALQREFADLIHGESWQTNIIPKAIAKTGAWFQEKVPLGEEPFIKPWMIDHADDHYELDISNARHLLDWEPEHNLRNTLPSMVHALKRDPLGWYDEHKIEPPRRMKKAAAR
jgi:nucleoside-diphosphate-sugar epimerase